MNQPLPQVRSQDKFAVEKTTSGGITCLTLRGTLDHAFEGRKVAASISTKKLIVNMRNVRRFASWGMSEWMDFLRITAAHDLYLVECSTYALSQLNLVTGLLGHGKLVSFYASYRCGSCSEEHEILLLTPRDREMIRGLAGTYEDCTTCGGRARLDEYPAAFFEKIADRPSFDIDDEVFAYLHSQLHYALAPDLTRFRAFRKLHKGYTYLRLSGDISMLPVDPLVAASEGTTVVDLSSILFDPSRVSEWQRYVQLAMPRLKSLQLYNCPPGFLESAMAPEDLGPRLVVRTFAIPYECMRCQAPTAYMVDVADNLEQLVAGIAPAAPCPTCGTPLVPALSAEQIAFMRSLPARDRDTALDKFLAGARNEPPDKLENCLVALPQEPPRAAAGGRRAIYVALALGVVLLAALTVVAVILWQRTAEPPQVAQNPGQPAGAGGPAPPPPTPAFERPDWIITEIPGSAYCHDLINRVMCVGVSSYRPTRDEAVAEANDAALEELVNAVGLKIADPLFRETIMPGYSAVRAKALSALQAELDAGTGATTAAEAVARARKRVVEILRVSGGAAVPAQRSDWHWEEYAAKKGGTELLVFVRYDVTLDAIKALVEKYTAAIQALGSTAVTAFPALAWQHPEFTGGALLTKVGQPLAGAGVAAQSVVMAVGDRPVGDATALVRRLDEWKQATGDLKLTVKTGDAPARPVEIPRARVR